jgi:diguanylate cyclase (GGDEF)-like protein
MLVGNYNPLLVVVSLLVAILASFTALDMAGRVTRAKAGRASWLWLAGGACAMGFGIWSMHFIGMLAFRLPIPLGYDLWNTLQSLLIAVVASAFALWLVSQPTLPHFRLALGATLMGLGIASMHYLGMAAMKMQPGIVYDKFWFVLSVVVAIAAAWAALFIAFRLRSGKQGLSPRLAAAVAMGVAIVGMHYTGMAAAQFPAGSVCGAAVTGGLPNEWLAAFVVVLTVAILAVALSVSWLDQLMHARLLHLRNTMLVSSLDDARKELAHASHHDPLTQLPTRQRLQAYVDSQLQRDGEASKPFTVLMLGLDGFRHVNQAYGHQTGDLVLVNVAEQLKELLKPGEFASRLGGDQFVLVVDSTDEVVVTELADQLIQRINAIRVAGRSINITASVGIVIHSAGGTTEQRLMSSVETAFQHAKNAGRNTYTMFADWMYQDAEQNGRLLTDLRSAIGTSQLFLHYQPKAKGGTGVVNGAEALLRWRHPQHGMIPTERMIRLAEQNGLINPIGSWVLDEACRQLRCWHDAGYEDWKISVNLSPVQLSSPHLYDEIQSALTRHELAPQSLILEITENAMMRDPKDNLELLRNLTRTGIGLAIDDFGTGYSSLLYLKRLPATELKIDHEFIKTLEQTTEDIIIISAIISLGHALNMEIVAEGVETPGQRVHLERLGCDCLQGYLIGRPVSAETFFRQHGTKQQLIAPATAGDTAEEDW